MRTVATTRTQRRMERKQALLLLVMVLAVALVSFALGVMVGRGGAPQAVSQKPSRRTPVTQGPAPDAIGPGETVTKEARVDLTFYETLPKGEAPPLGSGINLPPEQSGQGEARAEVEAVPKEVIPSEKKMPTVKVPSSRQGGGAGVSYVLQVASFRSAKDAQTLSLRLKAKGYPVRVSEVDLGAKGAWSRVLVGPFATQDRAHAVQGRLEAEERVSPMLRKE